MSTAAQLTTSYRPKETALKKRKKQIVDEQLEKLLAENGAITPDLILDRARDEDHPLHSYFEWDDSTAAEKYRRIQAYQMLLASKFVCLLQKKTNGDVTIVEAVDVRKILPETKGGGFKMRNEALGTEEARKHFAERKLSELRSWLRSIVDVPELAPLRAKVQKLVDSEV